MTRLAAELPLRCRCGQVRGVAREGSPTSGFRFVCYCKDCQAFARFLDRPDVLDTAGGTDIFQMPVGHLELLAGVDALRCLALSAKVFRWYADCCRTPIGNTAGARFPVIGLIHSFIGAEIDARVRSEMLGPPLCRIFARLANGALPRDAPPPPSFRVFVNRTAKILGWWARGLGRPNPFFDEQKKAPRSVPCMLTQR